MWRHSERACQAISAGVVAREVAHLQRLPQRLSVPGSAECSARFCRASCLRASISASRLGLRAAQRAQRQPVQVFQQLALPGVPHLGAGAADVGHGQQVQRGQPALGAHLGGEGGDHVGVGQVFLLRDAAHRQVVAHQELDQLRRLRGRCRGRGRSGAPRWRPARSGRRRGPWPRRGTARPRTAPRACPTARQLAAERVLVRVLGDEEAAHVAQHHQDVLVHGVDVEQVVLHAPDDARNTHR
jgi:hypothetical protein